MDYCNALLYGLPKYLINRLQLLQNLAAHLVTLTRRQEHITPILRSLHWLPVHYRIVLKILLLTYKALNGLAPDYIKDLLKYNDSRRTLRSSTGCLMSLERILKRMVKGLFPWRHQGSGINYHSRSGFYQQRQFLRLIFRLIF